MSVTVPGTAAEAGLAKGPYRAPRGTAISCKGWQREAAQSISSETILGAVYAGGVCPDRVGACVGLVRTSYRPIRTFQSSSCGWMR